MSGGAFAVTHHPSVAEQEGQLIETEAELEHLKNTIIYTKSVSWQHHQNLGNIASFIFSGKPGTGKTIWQQQSVMTSCCGESRF